MTESNNNSPTAQETDLFALELRLHLLESLIAGSTTSFETLLHSANNKQSLARRKDDCVGVLNSAVEGPGHEPIRRFLEYYESSEPLLKPQIGNQTTIGTGESEASSLDLTSKAHLVLDASSQIKMLQSTLVELETLEKRDVASAGKLTSYEELEPLLQKTAKELVNVSQVYSSLEDRVTDLAERYDRYVNKISEVFLAWHQIILGLEQEQCEQK